MHFLLLPLLALSSPIAALPASKVSGPSYFTPTTQVATLLDGLTSTIKITTGAINMTLLNIDPSSPFLAMQKTLATVAVASEVRLLQADLVGAAAAVEGWGLRGDLTATKTATAKATKLPWAAGLKGMPRFANGTAKRSAAVAGEYATNLTVMARDLLLSRAERKNLTSRNTSLSEPGRLVSRRANLTKFAEMQGWNLTSSLLSRESPRSGPQKTNWTASIWKQAGQHEKTVQLAIRDGLDIVSEMLIGLVREILGTTMAAGAVLDREQTRQWSLIVANAFARLVAAIEMFLDMNLASVTAELDILCETSGIEIRERGSLMGRGGSWNITSLGHGDGRAPRRIPHRPFFGNGTRVGGLEGQ